MECLLLQTFAIQLLERTNKVCCFSSSCQATSCHKTKRRASRQKIGEFLEALFVLYRPQTTKLSLPWPQHCKKTIQPKEFPVLYPSPSEENCARSIIYCAETSKNEATISLANAFPFVPLFWVKELHRAQSGLFMMRSFTAQCPKRNYFSSLHLAKKTCFCPIPSKIFLAYPASLFASAARKGHEGTGKNSIMENDENDEAEAALLLRLFLRCRVLLHLLLTFLLSVSTACYVYLPFRQGGSVNNMGSINTTKIVLVSSSKKHCQ